MQKCKNKLTTLFITASFCHAAPAYQAPKAETAPIINGVADDTAWHHAPWSNIDQLTLGETPSKDDFQGRYKLVWTQDKLFILAEITDDVLIDTHADPLVSYWEDDTFEIFIDENKSGGDHLNNYNAMAYHIALDNQVVDINSSAKPSLFNHHVTSHWQRSSAKPNVVIWEASIDVYPDTLKDRYQKNETSVSPVRLFAGKKLGFLVAYCDSDSPQGRESFISSLDIPAINGDKNRAYITADVFDTLTLVDTMTEHKKKK